MVSSDGTLSCWKRRTFLEKILLFSTLFLGAATIGLIAGIIIIAVADSDEKHHNETTIDTCYSKGCIETANNVLKNMNPEVDPCSDFYEFACGNFLKETVIPDDKASVSSFSAISDDLEIKLRTIIEEIPNNDGEIYASLVKKLYDSCKDEEAIEISGLTEIRSIIAELGGWPVVEGDGWIPPVFPWHSYASRLRTVGYSTNYFIDLGVDVDWRDTSKHLLQIDQASLGIPREFLIDGLANAKVKAYFEYMVGVARIFGAEEKAARAQLEDSLKLEIKLAEISKSREERRDYNRMYNKMPISELQRKYSVITDWKTYIEGVISISDITINDNEINVLEQDYLRDLQGALATVDKRVTSNYVIWRIVKDSISYLNKELRGIQLKFNSEMSGVKEMQKRWTECVAITTDLLPIGVGSLYVRKHFKDEAREKAQMMVDDIRNEFKEILKNVDWMDDVTRSKALEKATTMTSHIAFPDELTNNQKLAQYYASLNFPSTNYLRTILPRNYFSTTNSFKKLNEPVDKQDWTHHANAAVVNAFYNSIYNSIEFPAGILQGVFFNNGRPRYMNYGAIGFVIGHEITHGFDDQGRQFDKDGNLDEWWNEDTKEFFRKKAQCIIDQYGNYKVEEIDENLNGVNTQGENIADNGGIKEAYLAYKAMVERDGVEKRLPGLQKYTNEQMFWISAANVWCIKYTLEDLALRVKTGVHSPGRFRVIGPMSNLELFSNDFNCPVGSKMNPREKCVVW